MQTDTKEGDQSILGVGTLCTASSCNLVDFLPVKCDHCKEPFCSDHFKPESHNCSKWDQSQADRRALECLVCTKLIAIPPGTDPNVRMDEHLERECSGKAGVVAANSVAICAAPRCQKKLVAQEFPCKDCKLKFCASHYHPGSHKCASTAKAPSTSQSMLSKMSAPKSAAALAALQRVKNSGTSSVKKHTPSAASASGRANNANAASSSSTTEASTSTEAKNTRAGTFSAIRRDNRAKQERLSQLKSMKTRIDKGLITDPEEIKRYERLKAEYEEKKNECILM